MGGSPGRVPTPAPAENGTQAPDRAMRQAGAQRGDRMGRSGREWQCDREWRCDRGCRSRARGQSGWGDPLRSDQKPEPRASDMLPVSGWSATESP